MPEWPRNIIFSTISCVIYEYNYKTVLINREYHYRAVPQVSDSLMMYKYDAELVIHQATRLGGGGPFPTCTSVYLGRRVFFYPLP